MRILYGFSAVLVVAWLATALTTLSQLGGGAV